MTKLAKKQNDLALSTSAKDICKTKLRTLVNRLSSDLKNDSFDEPAVNIIEMVRNVSDLKQFALEVKKYGAIQAGHRLSSKFLLSVREITGSVDEIPDEEIRENFSRFLKEKHTSQMEEKKLDSKRLIMDLCASLSEIY